MLRSPFTPTLTTRFSSGTAACTSSPPLLSPMSRRVCAGTLSLSGQRRDRRLPVFATVIRSPVRCAGSLSPRKKRVRSVLSRPAMSLWTRARGSSTRRRGTAKTTSSPGRTRTCPSFRPWTRRGVSRPPRNTAARRCSKPTRRSSMTSGRPALFLPSTRISGMNTRTAGAARNRSSSGRPCSGSYAWTIRKWMSAPALSRRSAGCAGCRPGANSASREWSRTATSG